MGLFDGIVSGVEHFAESAVQDVEGVGKAVVGEVSKLATENPLSNLLGSLGSDLGLPKGLTDLLKDPGQAISQELQQVMSQIQDLFGARSAASASGADATGGGSTHGSAPVTGSSSHASAPVTGSSSHASAPVASNGYAPPTTPPPTTSSGASTGAGSTSSAGSDNWLPPSLDKDTAVMILQQNFNELDTASSGAHKDGLFNKADLQAALNDPSSPPELKAACKYMLENPAAFNQLDTSEQKSGTADGLVSLKDTQTFDPQSYGGGFMGGAEHLIDMMKQAKAVGAEWTAHEAAAKGPSHHQNPPTVRPPSTNATSGATPSPTVNNSTVDTAGVTYQSALQTIQNNFGLFDTASGKTKPDGLISKGDLQHVINDPGVPADVKAAAEFMLQNSTYFSEAETAQFKSTPDGLLGAGDVASELARLKAAGATGGSSGAGATGGSQTPPNTTATGSATSSDATGGSSSTSTVNTSDANGPATINAGHTDGTLEGTLDSLQANAQTQIDRLMSDLSKGDLSPTDLAKVQAKMQQIQQMLTMVTNMQKELHDMQMAIINNIR